jgi:predicted RNA-binding protein with PIN domain
MSLQYIIDGYNVINHPLFSRLNKKSPHKETALLDFIRVNKLCGKLANCATVVFDGFTDLRNHGSLKPDIDVVFSRQDSADERIQKMIERAPQPKNLVVVSDDKEIAFFAASRRARPMSVEEFVSRAPGIRLLRAQDKQGSKGQKDDAGPKVSYSEMHKINSELRKIWLK